MARKSNKQARSAVKLTPLGGVGEIGKNMTVIEYEDDMIVIDCGLSFPREEMLGVDYVIPDTTYLEKNRDKLRAFVITHGHEDHIGAAPYVLGNYNVPVYGTQLTLALMETKLTEHGINASNLTCIHPGGRVKAGVFEIEFIKVSHSIDDAVGLAIHTPCGVIVHTGDFKVDFTPIDGKVIDLHKFADLGEKGVLALLSDSTNAEKPGSTISEREVGSSFADYFDGARGRIIIATFASNIHRLQQVIDQAKSHNRKVCLTGRSMLKITGVASELGYLDLPENMIIKPEELPGMRDSKVVILTTGSQGENMSGLVRMAAGEHPQLKIKQGDLVIISAQPIPGNERYVSDVVNMLFRKGAQVIYSRMAQVHVSGHACQDELKLMLSLVKPRYFIPVHGEYRHLYHHADLAFSMGMDKKSVFIPELGRTIELTPKSARTGGTVTSGSVLIDGLGIGDVGSVVLRDRKQLSSDGLFIVVVTISKDIGEMVTGPDIVSRGFVYMRESEVLLEEARCIVRNVVATCELGKMNEWLAIKAKIKKALAAYLYEQTKRSPMILPIIIEI